MTSLESIQLKESTADALIRSALRNASFVSSWAFIANFTCPLQSWSMMEVGMEVSLPVTACKGESPILLLNRFLALKHAEATSFTSSKPRACCRCMVLIIMSFTMAPCRSTWPCLHLAPGGTTSCLKSKMRPSCDTISSYSLPPSVWNTSGGPKTEHHLSRSSSAVTIALACLLTIPKWYSVRPSSMWVTLNLSPSMSQTYKESDKSFSPNRVGLLPETLGSAPGGRTDWQIWQRRPSAVWSTTELHPLICNIRFNRSGDGWPSTTCRWANAWRTLCGPCLEAPSKYT